MGLPFLEICHVRSHTPLSGPNFCNCLRHRVWAHFAALCSIPHPSKNETPLVEFLQKWAERQGLSHCHRPGRQPDHPQNRPQPGANSSRALFCKHIWTWFCQKNSDTTHDFLRDPIRPVVRDGWVVAEQTTLGADNGIGVALILAALEDSTLTHGPIEALLTIDEEDGMGGAHGLESGLLQGKYLLNLDTEEWGEFYLGCAGGMDVYVTRPGQPEAVPADWQLRRLDIAGLRGRPFPA